MSSAPVVIAGELTASFRVDVFTTATALSGYGIRAVVYVQARLGEDRAEEVRACERTHFFPRGHSGEAMVREYLGRRMPWWALADWLDENPESLTGLPEFVRYAVGPSFREYHEQRETRFVLQPA